MQHPVEDFPTPQPGGWIEIICGSMFSGKTEELIRRVRRAKLARQEVQVFKPLLDNRYSRQNVISHGGWQIEAVPVESARDIPEQIHPDTRVIAIDEVQFFDWNITEVVNDLAGQGKRVILAGLDLDFRGEPFGPMPVLIAQADQITKLQAICMTCGAPATRTQRLINGQPANYHDPIILVGAQEWYEARCRHCHAVPRDRDEQ